MKKLLSLFLALTIVLSCTALAAAPAEDLDPPLWEQMGYNSYEELMSAGLYTEEEYAADLAGIQEVEAWKNAYKATHPDEVAAFEADAYFDDYYIPTKEQFMTDYDIATQEEFRAYMMDSWLSGLYYAEQRQNRIDSFKASHPDEVAAFDPQAYYEKDFDTWGGDPSNGMENLGITDEQEFFDFMLDAYITEQEILQGYKDDWAARQAAEPERVARFLAELDGWLEDNYWGASSFEEYMKENVGYGTCEEQAYLTLYNGWNTPYAAEQERIAQRNAFITARGGVVGALNVMLDGQYLAFSEGRAPYAKGGVTYADAATLSGALGVDIPAPIDGYVSIRSAAEAAGLKVWWDGDCQSVVLIDVKKAAAEIDKDFTILNGALAKWKTDLTKNYKAGMTLKADVTLFDSLDGDKTGSMTYALDILLSAKGMQMTGKYDMTRLMNLLLSATESDEYAPDADTLAQAKAAMKGDFELRWDFEKAMAYMKASALDWYYKQLTNATAAAGAWFPVPLDGLDFETLLNTPAATYGGIVCGNIDTYSLITTPVYYYDTLTDFDNTKEAFGDDCFTKSGSNYTLTLGQDDFAALMGQDSEESWYDAPEKFDLTLTLRPDGSVSGKVLHQDTNEDSYYYGEPATRVTADFNFSLANQKLTLEVHGKNTYKVVVTMSGTTSTTTKTPAIAPPDGATVVED